MSQWTYINGSIRLNSNPHEFKGKKDTSYRSKDAYLPFPEEQLKLSIPDSYYEEHPTKGTYSGLKFGCNLYSLPRAKKYIDKAFELLPQGEVGWSYTIHQDSRNSYMSSSDFDYPCDEKAFIKAVENFYKTDDPFDSMPYKQLKSFYNIEFSYVDSVTEMIIGISESLRWCSGEELLEGLENFFTYLLQNGISVSDGYLEWVDAWNDNYIYAWRVNNYLTDDNNDRHRYSFYKLDKKTNKIIWSKSYFMPYLKNEKGEIVWNEKHTYKKVDYWTAESEIIEKNY